jgi:hypothetical protein
LNGTIEVSDSAVEVAFLSLGITPVSVRKTVLRIELYGLIQISHCSVQIALPELDISQVVVGNSICGLSLMA